MVQPLGCRDDNDEQHALTLIEGLKSAVADAIRVLPRLDDAVVQTESHVQAVIGDENAYVNRLLFVLDKILNKGLRDIALFGRTVIWEYLENLSECLPGGDKVIGLVEGLSRSDLARGRLFVRYALNEQSLTSYLEALVWNRAMSARYYDQTSLIASEEYCSMMFLLLENLKSTKFRLSLADRPVLSRENYWSLVPLNPPPGSENIQTPPQAAVPLSISSPEKAKPLLSPTGTPQAQSASDGTSIQLSTSAGVPSPSTASAPVHSTIASESPVPEVIATKRVKGKKVIKKVANIAPPTPDAPKAQSRVAEISAAPEESTPSRFITNLETTFAVDIPIAPSSPEVSEKNSPTASISDATAATQDAPLNVSVIEAAEPALRPEFFATRSEVDIALQYIPLEPKIHHDMLESLLQTSGALLALSTPDESRVLHLADAAAFVAAVEDILLDGLRPDATVWGSISKFFPKDDACVQQIQSRATPRTDRGRLRAFLHSSLNQRLAKRKVEMFSSLPNLLSDVYWPTALLANDQRASMLLTLLADFDAPSCRLEFRLPVDGIELDDANCYTLFKNKISTSASQSPVKAPEQPQQPSPIVPGPENSTMSASPSLQESVQADLVSTSPVSELSSSTGSQGMGKRKKPKRTVIENMSTVSMTPKRDTSFATFYEESKALSSATQASSPPAPAVEGPPKPESPSVVSGQNSETSIAFDDTPKGSSDAIDNAPAPSNADAANDTAPTNTNVIPTPQQTSSLVVPSDTNIQVAEPQKNWTETESSDISFGSRTRPRGASADSKAPRAAPAYDSETLSKRPQSVTPAWVLPEEAARPKNTAFAEPVVIPQAQRAARNAPLDRVSTATRPKFFPESPPRDLRTGLGNAAQDDGGPGADARSVTFSSFEELFKSMREQGVKGAPPAKPEAKAAVQPSPSASSSSMRYQTTVLQQSKSSPVFDLPVPVVPRPAKQLDDPFAGPPPESLLNAKIIWNYVPPLPYKKISRSNRFLAQPGAMSPERPGSSSSSNPDRMRTFTGFSSLSSSSSSLEASELFVVKEPEVAVDAQQAEIQGQDPRLTFVLDVLPKKKFGGRTSNCSRCGVDLQKVGLLGKEPPYCYYTANYCCRDCQKGKLSIIPARVVSSWDFKEYPVCDWAKRYIDENFRNPILDFDNIRPEVQKRIASLMHVLQLREKLVLMGEYIQSCRNSSRLLQEVENRTHLVWSAKQCSLEDLTWLRDNRLEKFISHVVDVYTVHITTCEICKGKGFFCEICNSKQLLFLFQERVVQCHDCKSVFHSPCFDAVENCPKCERVKRFRARRTSASSSAAPVEQNQVSTTTD